MTTPSKAQIVAILGAIALLVLLLFARKTGAPESTKKSEVAEVESFSMNRYIDSTKKTIDAALLSLIDKQEHVAVDSVVAFDSLSKLWSAARQMGVDAYYSGKVAAMKNTADNWNKAAGKFYGASRFAKDASVKYFIDNAIACYTKGIELDSTDLDAKVSLAVCYVQGTQDPMKGIMLLRGVAAKDSTNINAQLNLGLFAVQSGQYDKAVERFNRILRIDPKYTEAYLYLGQTFANKGDKKKAIEALEKYKKLSNDSVVSAEVTQYINQIKNS